MSFEDNIKEWVKVDNEVRALNEKVKQLRDVRSNIIEKINYSIDKGEIPDGSVVEINDSILKLQRSKTVKPYTNKFIAECLNECIPNPEDAKRMMDYIQSKREYKETRDIKRNFKV